MFLTQKQEKKIFLLHGVIISESEIVYILTRALQSLCACESVLESKFHSGGQQDPIFKTVRSHSGFGKPANRPFF
jgi:hypothetical protein